MVGISVQRFGSGFPLKFILIFGVRISVQIVPFQSFRSSAHGLPRTVAVGASGCINPQMLLPTAHLAQKKVQIMTNMHFIEKIRLAHVGVSLQGDPHNKGWFALWGGPSLVWCQAQRL